MSQTNKTADDAGRTPHLPGTLTRPATPFSDASPRSGKKLLQKGIRLSIFVSLLVKKTAKPPLSNTVVADPDSSAPAVADDTGAGGNTLQVQAGLEVTLSNPKYGEIWYCGRFIGSLLITLKKSRPQVVSDSKPAPAPATEQHPEVIIDIPDVHNIVHKRDLSGLKNIGGVQAVVQIFGSNLEEGLLDRPAQALTVTMPSVQVQARELVGYMVKAGRSVTILLLLISALLCLAKEMLSEGPKWGWHDSLVIMMAVLILITFPSVSEFYQSRKLSMKELERGNKLSFDAVRNGRLTSISIHHVEPGEIVVLTKGCRIPGNGLFVDGSGLVVDEVLHSKIDHDNPFLFSGSKVIEGNGRMIVTSVDKHITPDKPVPKTLLQTRLEKPNSYADKIALCMFILVTLVTLIRILNHHHDGQGGYPELKGRDALPKLMMMIQRIPVKSRGLVSILTTALPVMVFSLQQGVSIVITFSLSYWNKKAGLWHAKAKNLSACGTMGLATVCCIDVSGGVLINEMKVVKCLIGENVIFDANGLEKRQVVCQDLQKQIAMSLLVRPESPVDVSFCAWIKSEWGLNEELMNESFEFFDSKELRSNNCSGFLMKKRGGDNENKLELHCKGCPRSILEMCTHYYDREGNEHPLQSQKSVFEQWIKVMEDDCLMPIAFACPRISVEEMLAEDDLSLLAIVGFQKSARIARETLSEDGVKFILLSGDKPHEAKDVACDLGICNPGSEVVLEGEEFRRLNEEKRREMVNEIQIMASSLPEDKVLLVRTLKEEGYVVVFLGGLATRDTPALNEADVGITMESYSTQKAQEGSDIVLTAGGSLCSLPSLRKLGRCSYHNIQKFIQLELTACISGVVFTAVTAIISEDSPISAVSLLYVNFIPCILGGYEVMVVLPNQEVVTNQKIRHESIMTPAMWRGVITQLLYQVSVLLIIHLKAKDIRGMNEKVRKSMIFNTLALCQIFNKFNIMGLEKKEIFLVAIKHCWFVVAVGMVIVVQVLVMEFVRTSLFNCAKLNRAEWAFCVLFAGFSWAFDRTLQFVSLFLGKWLSESSGTYMRAPTWMPFLFFAFLGLSFAVALVTGTR